MASMFTTTQPFVYAGFGRRLVAEYLDWLIVSGLNFAFSFSLQGHTPLDAVTFDKTMAVTTMLFYLAYNIGFLERFGATPAKLLLGMRVVRPDGGPLGPGRAFARPLAEFLSGILLYLGYLMAAFDDEQRTLHDRLCGTRVVLKR